ncbi:MAG: 3-hydroxyacyl-CoA dehydrogenase NAD-binding domain-containing protein [Galactobacter sp.]
MSQDIFTPFELLREVLPNEVITHTQVQDVTLASGKTLALITLDNGQGPRRPATLGPATMIEFGRTLLTLKDRAAAGEIDAVALTGCDYVLVAGADLSSVSSLTEDAQGRAMAGMGHAAYDLLADLGVPTFAFINGTALGGGLEIALACTYRTVSSGANGIGLPEAFIGLVPGWGGVYRLPRLVGPEAALTVMIENPLNNNRSINGKLFAKFGGADALFEPADFVEQSLAWADSVLTGETTVQRPFSVDPSDPEVTQRWQAAVAKGRALVQAKTSGAAPAPTKVLDIFEAGASLTQPESADLEIEALTGLMKTPQFQNTVYAFLDLVQKRGKRPAGAPDKALARKVTKVGVVGAGLMAAQLSLVFAQKLKVPVVMTDMDQERVDRGVAHAHADIDKQLSRGRISQDAANRAKALITGSVDKSVYADADWVIEAVFEEIGVKKAVFAELEEIVSEECILATNTSSLSVTEMAEDLKHPERLLGFHFFNPVAHMPLVEIVRGPATTDEVLSTAFVTAKGLRKTAVLVKDAPAFVVNRLLLLLMAQVQEAYDQGMSAEDADTALAPMGLPMSPFTLAAMVGLPVAQHVSSTLHHAFPERFPLSKNVQSMIDHGIKGLWVKDEDGSVSIPQSTLDVLEFGHAPLTKEQLLVRTQDALAREAKLMLDEGVVAGPEDLDLCMILGAGWPMFIGGLTPYLDQTGASERVNGARFHG